MDKAQIERYSRQILLPEIDLAGQQRLLAATVLIVGAGGLGSPAALYLAASGVGHLILNDHDRVDLGNLQRQILYETADIGRSKVVCAAQALGRLNPGVTISTLDGRLTGSALLEQVRKADVVLDASDNFPTRFAVNAACIAARTPLVWGAAIRFEGQATVFDCRDPDSACLRCLFPEDIGQMEEESCADGGILAPVTGIIGSIMAVETLKQVLGIGTTLRGRLLCLNAATMQWRAPRLARDPQCPACGSSA